jgi:hypothetical protein
MSEEKFTEQDAAVHNEVRTRMAAGKCGKCNAQLNPNTGECPIHYEDTAKEDSPKFPSLTDFYANSGSFRMDSSLDDYRHFAWWKGGTMHFGDEQCGLGICRSDSHHPDQVIVHYDQNRGKRLNPSAQDRILRMATRAKDVAQAAETNKRAAPKGKDQLNDTTGSVSGVESPLGTSAVLPRNITTNQSNGLMVWSTIKSLGKFSKLKDGKSRSKKQSKIA